MWVSARTVRLRCLFLVHHYVQEKNSWFSLVSKGELIFWYLLLRWSRNVFRSYHVFKTREIWCFFDQTYIILFVHRDPPWVGRLKPVIEVNLFLSLCLYRCFFYMKYLPVLHTVSSFIQDLSWKIVFFLDVSIISSTLVKRDTTWKLPSRYPSWISSFINSMKWLAFFT